MSEPDITDAAEVLKRIDALKKELEKHGAKVQISVSVQLPLGKYTLKIGKEAKK
jgi:uncharacterized protein with GYD domain